MLGGKSQGLDLDANHINVIEMFSAQVTLAYINALETMALTEKQQKVLGL